MAFFLIRHFCAFSGAKQGQCLQRAYCEIFFADFCRLVPRGRRPAATAQQKKEIGNI